MDEKLDPDIACLRSLSDAAKRPRAAWISLICSRRNNHPTAAIRENRRIPTPKL